MPLDIPGALPMQTRDLPIGASAVNADTRTVRVVFSTGASVRRMRWTGWDTAVPFDEVLEVSARAVDLTRMNAGGPVLDSHSTWSTGSQVAVVERAWIAGNEALAEIRFPAAGIDERADRMFGLVSDGIIRNVSVGYIIDQARVIDAEKRGEVEKRIVERWTPTEISFVTVPADAGAQVRSGAGEAVTYPITVTRAAAPTQEISMPGAAAAANGQTNDTPTPETRAAPIAPPAAPAPAPSAQAPVAENTSARAAEIITLAERHGMPQGWAAEQIRSTATLDAVRAIVLDAVAERSAANQINNRVQVITDAGDTLRAAVQNAILHRANPQAVQLDDAARQWRGMRLLEMGRVYHEETTGERLRDTSSMELAGRLLGLGGGLSVRSGGMSTSDFPILLANVASKRMRDAYGAAVQTWKPFSRQSNLPDFKERAVVALNGIPELKKIREGGEYTHATLGEGAEKYALATYGRKIAITRQTLINDDLGAFDRLPSLFARAAAELESDIVWGVLLKAHKMGDGKDLFHTDHGNTGTAGDPSETTVNELELLMGQQVDAAGKPLNLPIKFLAVSRKHKLAALKLVSAITAANTGDVNVYANSFDIIVEDRLYNKAGASPWFAITDPGRWDTIEYAYLEGEQGLYTEERIGFDVDGIEIKGRLDFAAKAIDFRGFGKNPGN
ncbi:prohead protease/major capsid protein fusion protein [Camelimonas sp. ID_303_24]